MNSCNTGTSCARRLAGGFSLAFLASLPASAQLAPGEALVVSGTEGEYSIIDLGAGAVATFPLAIDTLGAAITPDGSRAFLTGFNDQKLAFVDLTTNPPTVDSIIALPLRGEDVTLTSTGFLIVADGAASGANVPSIDAVSGAIVDSIFLPHCSDVAVTPDATLVMAADVVDHRVRFLELSPAGAFTDTGVFFGTGSEGPLNVAVSPDGSLAIIGVENNGLVHVITISGPGVSGLGFQKTIDLGTGNSQSIAFSNAGDRAYVFDNGVLASPGSGEVSVLDVDPSGDVTDSGLRVGGLAFADTAFGLEQIAVTPDDGTVLVHSRGVLTLIDASSLAIADEILIDETISGEIAVRPGSGVPPNGPPQCAADFTDARARFLEVAPDSFVVTEGETFEATFTGTDPDGDGLTSAASGLPAGASFDAPSGSSPLVASFSFAPAASQKADAPFSIEVVFSDEAGSTGSCAFEIADVNLHPVCDAGGGPEARIVVPAEGPQGASVTLAGSASDPDGAPADLVFCWEATGVSFDDPARPDPTATFPVGNTLATLTVTDGRGGFAVCDVLVSVQDQNPPEVMCTTDLAALWPPNHKMRSVEVRVVATDDCDDPSQLQLVSVLIRSDEPDDALGNGDGNTTGDVDGHNGFLVPVDMSPDMVFEASTDSFVGSLELRAERDGGGDGRAYTIDVLVSDSGGNQTTATCVVVVPHDKRLNLGG